MLLVLLRVPNAGWVARECLIWLENNFRSQFLFSGAPRRPASGALPVGEKEVAALAPWPTPDVGSPPSRRSQQVDRMPRHPPPASSLLAQAKADCLRAHRVACEAEPGMAPILHEWLADAREAVTAFPIELRPEVWRRLRILYAIIDDKSRWSSGVMR